MRDRYRHAAACQLLTIASAHDVQRLSYKLLTDRRCAQRLKCVRLSLRGVPNDRAVAGKGQPAVREAEGIRARLEVCEDTLTRERVRE